MPPCPLGGAGRRLAVGLSLPVWDQAALLARLDLLRWPSDLDLFRNIPAFVSLGFLGIETVPKVWRRVDRFIAGTTSDAVAALLPKPVSVKPPAQADEGRGLVVLLPPPAVIVRGSRGKDQEVRNNPISVASQPASAIPQHEQVQL